MRTFTPLQLKLIRHKLDLQQAVPTPQDLKFEFIDKWPPKPYDYYNYFY